MKHRKCREKLCENAENTIKPRDGPGSAASEERRVTNMAEKGTGIAENKISVIVTTQGRFLEMASMLYSIGRQTHVPREVVAGMQDTSVRAEELAPPAGYDIVSISLPTCSLSHARNTLLSHATGNIIALADDDCVYPDGIFSIVATFFSQHPNCSCIICDWDRRTRQARHLKQTRRQLFRHSPSYRVFCRRDALLEAGLFDEDMGIGAPTLWQSGEELDMLLRIFDAGHEIWRILTPPIKHPAPLQYTRIAPKKITGYGYGRMYLLAKHRFPLWFRVLNIIYPLAAIGYDITIAVIHIVPYRLKMFTARLAGFFMNFMR